MTKRHPFRLLCPDRRASLAQALALVLAAAVHSTAALSQTVAPNAAPTGGSVVGGTATIAKTPTTTQIDQSTSRAIINWQSFSVGQNQAVTFQQPSSQALTLNRVTGPDMSVIAGRITANGGIALVNQSGVFFARGAQVQAQSVIVSTADISNRNFMAGGAMTFDQPGKPDARIVNDGSITIKQAGLAALVAPQVVNHGVIQARLGTVVLAGAETHVIDLNGDGLVSFDVTGAVRQAPNNGEALVTNTGVIRANGGTVRLTAAAADGIVQDLVRAGGKIQANTDAATGTTGRILLAGTGGSISVAGAVSAQGLAAGTQGGTIGVVADRVQIESTGRVNASGRAGGGTIAIGTSLPGAATQRLAQGTGIAQGAVVKADATGKGNGGHIVVNASQQALVAGSISVRGGPAGGNGGSVEVSSHGGLVLSATIDAGAPAGVIGSVLLDPDSLTVVADNDSRANVTNGELSGGILAFGTDSGAADYITTSQIANITGALTLQATTAIDVEVGVNKPQGDLTLTSNGSLIINAPLTLGAGDLQLGGAVVTINALVTVPTANTVTLTAEGSGTTSITEGGNGAFSAGTLTQSGAEFATISLGGANSIQAIGTLFGTNITVNNVTPLDVTGAISGIDSIVIQVNGANLSIDGFVGASGYTPTTQLLASGTVTIGANVTIIGGSTQITGGYNFTTNAPDPTAAGGIVLNGTVLGAVNTDGPPTVAFPVALAAGRAGINQTAGIVQATTLTVQSGGNVSLTTNGGSQATSNTIDTLGASTVQGDFTLAAYPLFVPQAGYGTVNVAGDVNVSGLLTIQAVAANLLEETGARILAGSLAATVDGTVTLTGANQVTLISAMSGDGIAFHNATDLEIAGPVTSQADANFATDGNLLVSGSVSVINSAILLQAGGNLTVATTGSLSATLIDYTSAPITLEAAAPASGFDATLPGAMSLAGVINAGTSLTLDAGTGGITQTQGYISAQTLAVQSGGDALLDRGGIAGGTPNSIFESVTTATAAGDFELDNGSTDITVPANITAGTVGLRTTGAINIGNCQPGDSGCTPVPVSLNAGSGRVTLQAASLAFNTGDSVIGGVVEIGSAAQQPLVAGDPAATAINDSFMVNQDVLAAITATTLRLGADTFRGTTGVTATTLTLGGPITLSNGLDLRSLGDVIQAAPFSVGTLSGAAGGNVILTLPANAATTIGDLSSQNTLDLQLAGTMSISGTVAGANVTLTAGIDMGENGGGNISANQLTLNAPNGAIALAGTNDVAQLNPSTVGTDLVVNDAAPSLSVPLGTTIQPGASLTLVNTGDLTINGTVSGTSTVLRSSDGTLTVNGHSAIARTGTLILSGASVVTSGLISSATSTVISASSATLGGQALGTSLNVDAPSITFNNLDASTMMVLLFPGTNGSASGTLQAAGLEIAGGGGVKLLGSIAGVSTGAAAALGVRASASGVNLGNQPPNAGNFTFNGCQIAVAGCLPVIVVIPPVTTNYPTSGPVIVRPTAVVPPTGVASSPGIILVQNDPRRFDPSLTEVWLGLPAPPPVGLFMLPSRDSGEDLELAPPNVRAEDF
jgi:filamentous hemagglutinin family protein